MSATSPSVFPSPLLSEPLWLVAHDFSPYADAAANLALDDLLAMRRPARIVLVHVYTVFLPPSAFDGAGISVGVAQLEQATKLESNRALERVADRLRERQRHAVGAQGSCPVTIESVARVGTPAEGVLAEAQRLLASRIVIGTHGRTGVGHFLLGSVAERVVRSATVPVLVAHAARLDKERP